jgi:hypothetical protein
VDVVTLFAIIVFCSAWFFYARSGADEPLARLFFGTLMGLGVGVGVLGLLNRLLLQH